MGQDLQDAFAPSYTYLTGAVAVLAEGENAKYPHLDPSHTFTLVTVETTRAFVPQLLLFMRDLGHFLK